MKLREQVLKELEVLKPDELFMVYELVRTLKEKRPEQRAEKPLAAHLRVREALKQCKNALSEDILEARSDRI